MKQAKAIIDITSDRAKAADYFREGYQVRIYPYGGFANCRDAKDAEEIENMAAGGLFAIIKDMAIETEKGAEEDERERKEDS